MLPQKGGGEMATTAKPRPSQPCSSREPLTFERLTPEELAKSVESDLQRESRRVSNALSAYAERIRQIDEVLHRTSDFSERQKLHSERDHLVKLSNEARAYNHELGQQMHKLQRQAQGFPL